jgi:hypothetical protein
LGGFPRPHMKRLSRKVRWVVAALATVVALILGAVVWLAPKENVLHRELDDLARAPYAERWSHPAFGRIRAMGPKAIPFLREAIAQKDALSTRTLLAAQEKWPKFTERYFELSEAKMMERRATACQVILTLGPAAKSAWPELVALFQSEDISDFNTPFLPLKAIGINEEIRDHLVRMIENEKIGNRIAKFMALEAIAEVKPPSERALKLLAASLEDRTQYGFGPPEIAERLGKLGANTPEVIAGLKNLQRKSKDRRATVAASHALWRLQGKNAEVLSSMFAMVEMMLREPKEIPPWAKAFPDKNDWGQIGTQADLTVEAAGEFFREAATDAADKAKAIEMLEKWGRDSERVHIQMRLLRSMLDLGYPGTNCVAICEGGLAQRHNYLRIQAAWLLADVAEKFPIDTAIVTRLIGDSDVCVRIYGAKVRWRQTRQPEVVVPVLDGALDVAKHRSYWHTHALPVALGVLKEIGPEARAARARVEELARDANPEIAKLADDTIVAMGQ